MSTFDDIAGTVSQVVTALAPIAEAVVPEAAVAISLGQKIIQGVIAAEPKAVALFEQIKSGTVPTGDQLQQYAADYEAAYQKLNADINAKLAVTPT